jgi:exopolyphosphatase/guanosine-5'-triphosphate,3'-diphosphate pyrophosphatase
VHGAYVVEHSDIAGFSQQEQRFLAALIRSHRRNVGKLAFDALPDRLLPQARRDTALLRLAVLLHRAHETGRDPPVELEADGNTLVLGLRRAWLDARPLLQADLAGEPDAMAALGIRLKVQMR